MKKYIFAFTFVIIAAVFANFTINDATAATAKPEKKEADTYELLNLFGEVFERVKEDYVVEVSDEQLIENALNGMLTSLDPHSSYLSDKAFKEMQVQTRGEFGGLGIEVTMENGLVKVVSPIDDTPAFRAGIMAGDYISHIDGEQVMGMTLSEAVEKMRGKVGSKITLTILREGANEPIDKVMNRDVIKIQTTKGHTEGDVGYIRLTQFAESTSDGMREQIKKIQDKLGKDKVKGYVLDLRNNPGGLLDQAIEVSDAFLDKGEIVSTRGRVADSGKRYNATKGDIINGLPLVVLINGGSASASEIVAGALQDHHRAIILGTKSFGKGSVQTVIPLTGHGAMRLTTSRYYTPSGRSIQAEGIEPDIEVKQAKIEYVEANKYYRNEAGLSRHLENPNEKKDKDAESGPVITIDEDSENKEGTKDDKDSKKMPALPGLAGKTVSAEDDSAKDFQLSRAVDLIRGLSIFGKK
jgi:carboxyl-terminal processing protease